MEIGMCIVERFLFTVQAKVRGDYCYGLRCGGIVVVRGFQTLFLL